MKLALDISKYNGDKDDPKDYLRIRIQAGNEDALKEISEIVKVNIKGSEDPKDIGLI